MPKKYPHRAPERPAFLAVKRATTVLAAKVLAATVLAETVPAGCTGGTGPMLRVQPTFATSSPGAVGSSGALGRP